jgi:SAM-dependent methyltransferase
VIPQRNPRDLEAYILRGSGAFSREVLARRQVDDVADFLLPHLRSESRVLDCGCGPGSVTLGLGAAVAPGLAVGLDFDLVSLTSGAAGRGDFVAGDAYAMPFVDRSFDVVFAHTLLIHLRTPLLALVEMRRVLRPGGLVAIRDTDWDYWFIRPSTSALLDQARELYLRVMRELGVDPGYARRLPGLLSAAGFVDVRVRPVLRVVGGSLESRQRMVADALAMLSAPVLSAVALERGWVSSNRLDAMRDAIRDWGTRPDASQAMVDYTALARVPHGE